MQRRANEAFKVFQRLRIYKTEILDPDWLRTVQFLGNSAEKGDITLP